MRSAVFILLSAALGTHAFNVVVNPTRAWRVSARLASKADSVTAEADFDALLESTAVPILVDFKG